MLSLQTNVCLIYEDGAIDLWGLNYFSHKGDKYPLSHHIVLPTPVSLQICYLLDDGLELEIQSEDYGIFPFCRMNGPLPELTCDLTSLVLYLKLIYSPLKLLLTNN